LEPPSRANVSVCERFNVSANVDVRAAEAGTVVVLMPEFAFGGIANVS